MQKSTLSQGRKGEKGSCRTLRRTVNGSVANSAGVIWGAEVTQAAPTAPEITGIIVCASVGGYRQTELVGIAVADR